MDNKSKTLIISTVILAVLSIILIVVLSNVRRENERLEAILEVSCSYSYNSAQCHNGLETLKSMDVKDIKKWSK